MEEDEDKKSKKIHLIDQEFIKMREEFFQLREFNEQFNKENNILSFNPLFSLFQLLIGLLFLSVGIIYFLDNFFLFQGNPKNMIRYFINYFKGVNVFAPALFFFTVLLSTIVCIFMSIFTINRLYSGKKDYEETRLGLTWTDTLLGNNTIVLLSTIGCLIQL